MWVFVVPDLIHSIVMAEFVWLWLQKSRFAEGFVVEGFTAEGGAPVQKEDEAARQGQVEKTVDNDGVLSFWGTKTMGRLRSAWGFQADGAMAVV